MSHNAAYALVIEGVSARPWLKPNIDFAGPLPEHRGEQMPVRPR